MDILQRIEKIIRKLSDSNKQIAVAESCTGGYISAVSDSVVKLLAYNIRVLSNVDIGIGISGIAGPTGGTPEKPVGLVFIGFSTERLTSAQECNLKADRITFKKMVLEIVLQILEELLQEGI